jgi:hypothetical protein
MLIVAPAWTAASRLAEPAVDNGEGSGKDWQRVKNQIEKERATGRGKTPRVEILVSVIRGKGKGKTASEGSDEDGSDVELPVRPKGKKRGPKAWTALENEGK